MIKQAYIVKGYRTAVAKSKRGGFRFKRADELAAELPEVDHFVGTNDLGAVREILELERDRKAERLWAMPCQRVHRGLIWRVSSL